MKILFLGSMMSPEMADRITLNSRVKPSVAPVNFQRNLLKGFSACGDEIAVRSLPPFATFPGSKILALGRKKETYYGGISGRFLPVINLPGIKQITTLISAFFSVLGWCVKNSREKEKCVLVYGQNAFIALPQIFLCKLFGVKSCNIITDPIRYVTGYDSAPGWKKLLLKSQWAVMDSLKRKYSAFVFLTEAMVEEYVRGDQPYILLEGIGDVSIFDPIPAAEKAQPPAVMYAGALTRGFGIPALLQAIAKSQQAAQFWFFGGGDCEAEIRQAEKNDPRIRFFGKVPWLELLQHMQEASLLVSVKPVGEMHSRYQFPSKIMEYMASGTAVAATRVAGIPQEYFNYVYPIDRDDADGIAEALEKILANSLEKLNEAGAAGRQFIAEQKNCFIQAERVHRLLRDLLEQKE